MRATLTALAATFALLLGAAVAAPPAQAQNRFWLENHTGQVIESAYVSPSRVNVWGTDVLGANVLPPGQRVWIVPQTSDCVLDIRVRYQGGAEETRWQVNACSLSRVVWGGGGAPPVAGKGSVARGDPSFTFVNETGAVIRELYVSLSSDGRWGPDRLGQTTLAPGQALPITLPAGPVCTVDVRVVYTNGAAQERRGLETCSRASLGWR